MKKSIVISGVAAALLTGGVAVNNLLADTNSNPAAAPAPQAAQTACNPCAMNSTANGDMTPGASGTSGCNPCAAQNSKMSNGSCNPCNPSAKTKNSCNPCSPW